MSLRPAVLLVPLLACCASTPAWAQAGLDTRMRDQLRQTILEMRKLEDENAALKVQLASGAPAAKPAKPAADEAELRRARGEAGRNRERAEQAEQALAAAQEQIAALQRELAASKSALGLSQEREQRLQQVGNELLSRNQSCQADNRKLLVISRDLIARYKDRGLADVLLAKEPLTGLRRVQLEKLAQDYEAQLREQTLPNVSSPPVSKTATASPLVSKR